MVHTFDLNFQTTEAIAFFVIPTSEGPVLVETGPHSTYPYLESHLKSLGYSPSDVKHVLLTHIHFDHAGAAWALAKEGAKVYVHPRGYKHLLDPSRLYNSAKRIYGDMMESLWGQMHSIPEELLIPVEDGQTIQIGDTPFLAHHTPGHASHHIAWQMGDKIFTGDVAGCKINKGPVVPPCPPPDIDIEAWFDSIDKIVQLNPKELYLTHYGLVTEVEDHFVGLKKILMDWRDWMKVPFDEKKSLDEITPAFKAYAANQLREAGLSEEEVLKYEAANPAWMSVAGLMRYWTKKLEKEQGA
ncbi:MAG: MBL fold metallo-hydrolase [Bacteroidota bacterium]